MPNTAQIKFKSSLRKGFTLIELLVVIGILSVLAVAALVTINPAEAQKKARDTQRLQDMGTIQSIIEQYLNDNPGVTIPAGAASMKSSVPATLATAKQCGTAGWIGSAIASPAVSLCAYANVLPIDPTNRAAAKVAEFGSTATVDGDLYYYVNVQPSGAYKICTRLESTANAAKLGGDGEGTNTTGPAADVLAVFSNLNLDCGS